ncbi:MAG TPA: SRPBCC family protein [Gaiellaceae bacterium]|nr:SRPBCC family protein [Gaiellaceae bacterium]
MTREFDAPKHLVFEAWTTPELVKRWWHANRGLVTVVEIDLRVGGTWRFAMVADDGIEVGFHGEYREIVPDVRIVSTEVYEGLPEGVTEEEGATVNTATFTEANERATLTLLIQATSKVSRDAIIDSGMEAGLQDALDLLEQTANSLR